MSTVVGMYYSGVDLAAQIRNFSPQQLIALAGLFGAAAFPLGFLLTSVSILFLRVVALLCRVEYEAVVSEAAWENMWCRIRSNLPRHPSWDLYAAATFDHELLSTPIHE